MTRRPDLEDLVGADLDLSERERLRRVHDLLLQAGPPPELSPEIEAGPTLAMTLGARPARGRGFVAGVNNNSDVAEEPTIVPGRPPAKHAAVNLYGARARAAAKKRAADKAQADSLKVVK